MSGRRFLLATRSAGKLREMREIFDEFGLSVVNASGSITDQQRLFRRLVSQHLEIEHHDDLVDESA